LPPQFLNGRSKSSLPQSPKAGATSSAFLRFIKAMSGVRLVPKADEGCARSIVSSSSSAPVSARELNPSDQAGEHPSPGPHGEESFPKKISECGDVPKGVLAVVEGKAMSIANEFSEMRRQKDAN
jgi:hypothetical protein